MASYSLLLCCHSNHSDYHVDHADNNALACNSAHSPSVTFYRSFKEKTYPQVDEYNNCTSNALLTSVACHKSGLTLAGLPMRTHFRPSDRQPASTLSAAILLKAAASTLLSLSTAAAALAMYLLVAALAVVLLTAVG
jgi:hypothetical protein